MPALTVCRLNAGIASTTSSAVAAAACERLRGRTTVGALLACSANVEQRVVDSDGETDAQDHGRDRLLYVQRVAQQVGHPERRKHRLKPSNSGRPAATSAPNASTRMNSVTGTERCNTSDPFGPGIGHHRIGASRGAPVSSSQ
jgi:hypothetical protein